MLAYSQSSSSTRTSRASHPFDCRDADIVLRSSDGVEFLVHKRLLRIASRVLTQLIPLARMPPPSSSSGRRHKKERPVLDLADSSENLDLFLRFIYPILEPSIMLNEVYTILELSTKYDAPSVAQRMRPHLLRPDHLEADPYVIYALATYAHMQDIAAVAARHTLSHPIPPTLKLTEMAEGTDLVRLLEYRKKCVAAAVSVTRIADDNVPWWVQLQWRRFCFLSECWECAKLLPGRSLKWHRTACGTVRVPDYWVEYMAAAGAALVEKLDPKVAKDRRLLQPAIECAMRCSKCAAAAWKDVEDFAEILAAAVEEAVCSVKFPVQGDEDEYARDDINALMMPPKTNYLSASDRPVWPMFDYFWDTWRKRIPEEDTTSVILEDDDHTLPPPSERDC
ncbi:hypothetical protein BD309DRAFT_492868 [Dichomitus squalens]|uniref:Uncharacterized protein n=2 Tax=Dichomitus squalens TaxID=114155 RepID=A0A4Q9NEM2_9APHY|nr:uncharacterized protein DICSQDRAFT_89014 [Dichomitus squalens LYAD-421 SS1]EJF59655.1 hypothetical protein DICSQDRAFT_89014 [Dichomitus squalens LYAD-421 SS1]TBU38737.1 hypothetical protein BD309DRAFT_492868 [Dichomitus squalens]TBU52879.1 hypothetical protein BD310DRAFT_200683 [Dichomitus squalens]